MRRSTINEVFARGLYIYIYIYVYVYVFICISTHSYDIYHTYQIRLIHAHICPATAGASTPLYASRPLQALRANCARRLVCAGFCAPDSSAMFLFHSEHNTDQTPCLCNVARARPTGARRTSHSSPAFPTPTKSAVREWTRRLQDDVPLPLLAGRGSSTASCESPIPTIPHSRH